VNAQQILNTAILKTKMGTAGSALATLQAIKKQQNFFTQVHRRRELCDRCHTSLSAELSCPVGHDKSARR
jgi:hypothetical protein